MQNAYPHTIMTNAREGAVGKLMHGILIRDVGLQ